MEANAPERIVPVTDQIEQAIVRIIEVIEQIIALEIEATVRGIEAIVGRIVRQAIGQIESKTAVNVKLNARIVVMKRAINSKTTILDTISGKVTLAGPDIVGTIPIVGQPGV